MQNNKENFFAEKFRLLNSQEYNEEINLASSSSSDYESVTHNNQVDQNKSRKKKRKRKNKYTKHNSSLDITFKDVIKDSKRHESVTKSPILCSKNPTQKQNILQQSPILVSTNIQQKSPILMPKILPHHYVKVKKQLFANNNMNVLCKKNDRESTIKSYNIQRDSINNSCSLNPDNYVGFCDKNSETTNENFTYSNILNRDNAKKDLIKKVKIFFESNFSSEELSQNAISDSQTSSRSEELVLYSGKSDINSDSPSVSSIKEKTSLNPESSVCEHEVKKVRYKKDGLAYRLNNLLKKRKAHLSLWQHERYLAGNSNFIIPKQEHIVFRIHKFHFKYGCYLLQVYDVSDKFYCIVINSYYINETIKNGSILKLYKPYQFVDLKDECKLVINVCKFEIVDINS